MYQAKNKTSNAPNTIIMGRIQNLCISRLSPHGAYLTPSQPHIQEIIQNKAQSQIDKEYISHAKTNEDSVTQVLLPNKFLPSQSIIGDVLKVFVYADSDDRPIATTQHPKAQRDDIAILKVVGHNAFGCFLDIGIDKDIFMPTKNPSHFALHQEVAVILTLDKQSRLIAKNVKSFLHKISHIPPHTQVKAFVFERTPLGFGCVVELVDSIQNDKNPTQRQYSQHSTQLQNLPEQTPPKYYGLLFTDAIPQNTKVEIGTYIDAYTQGYRDDNKLNLTLFVPHSDDIKSLILKSMPLHLDFSSSPEDIFATFHISKKLFKRFINELVREGQITFDKENGIFRRIK
ncbi:S1-like domain-containing RNA-binding protein [Helicobacter typhlonius]|uniref:S1-like domain-containing RNA-binding protein n=1 Tax=Helicobacter typhlonius TaxID=76936 RepID=UPI002FE32FB2